MINPNWTILIQIVNFLLLVFILNLVVYKPIRGMIQQRKNKFDNLESSIQTISNEADTKFQSFDNGIKHARQKGHQQKEELLKAATDQEKDIVARINAKAREDLALVKQTIAQDIGKVRIALEKELDTFADAIIQKILGRRAS